MKNYSDETVKQCISNLLARLDEAYGEGIHWYGKTPDWYVAATMVICDIEGRAAEASAMIMAEAKELETLHSNS